MSSGTLKWRTINFHSRPEKIFCTCEEKLDSYKNQQQMPALLCRGANLQSEVIKRQHCAAWWEGSLGSSTPTWWAGPVAATPGTWWRGGRVAMIALDQVLNWEFQQLDDFFYWSEIFSVLLFSGRWRQKRVYVSFLISSQSSNDSRKGWW